MPAPNLTFAARFNGPPGSANGGYAAGLAAQLLDAPAIVKLRAPPLLDTPLDTLEVEGGVDITHNGTVVIEARRREPLARPTVVAPTLDEARAAATHFKFDDHLIPGCFVCGCHREPGDGLRIFTAARHKGEMVADVWTPDADLAGDDGLVRPEFLWAALDCPGYWACDVKLALLGRLAADILTRPKVGEPLVVVGWPIEVDGRKHYAGTAVFTPQGDLLAHAEAIWVELKAPMTGTNA